MLPNVANGEAGVGKFSVVSFQSSVRGSSEWHGVSLALWWSVTRPRRPARAGHVVVGDRKSGHTPERRQSR